MVVDSDGKEHDLRSLCGGTGKNAFIYNYFTPEGKHDGTSRVSCNLCK